MPFTLYAFYLPPRQTIVVRQDGTPPANVKAVLKAVAPGSKWRGDERVWEYEFRQGVVLSLQEAAALLGAVLALDAHLERIAQEIFTLNEREHATRRLIETYIRNPKAPLGKYATDWGVDHPWRHQMISYHWGMRVEAFYIAHDPGLGKSREYVDLIRGKFDSQVCRPMITVELPQRKSTITGKILQPRQGVVGGALVVGPSVVTETLAEEFFKYQNVDALVIKGDVYAKMRKAGTPAPLHIINYESLESIQDNEYDLIVADEAHLLANEESNRFLRMLQLRLKTRCAVAGSGTSIPNMLPSMWAQYLWLDGGRSLGSSRERFMELYFDGPRNKLEAKADAVDRVSQAVARITYFCRKADALPDMPEKLTQAFYFPMSKRQAEYYERVRKDSYAHIMTGTVTTVGIQDRMMKLHQICQGFVKDDAGHHLEFNTAKLDALEKMLTGQGDMVGKKVIVWCRFLADIELVSQMLQRHQVGHLKFQGEGMTKRDRELVKHAWNTDPQWRVFVGMIQMGIGINLPALECKRPDGSPDACTNTVFYGVDWELPHLLQSIDRNHRGNMAGRFESCLYRFLLSAPSNGLPLKGGLIAGLAEEPKEENGDLIPIDVKVYRALLEKMKTANSVVEEGQAYYQRLLARG